MEQLRKNIQKNASTLMSLCRIAEAAMIISCLAAVFALIIAFTDGSGSTGSLKNEFSEIFSKEGILETLDEKLFNSNLSVETRLVSGAVIHILTHFMVCIFLNILADFLRKISLGVRPFSIENSNILKKIAFTSPLFLLYNPLITVLMFIAGMFLSNLVRYGAYLNDKADETGRIQEDMIISFAEIVENKSEQTGKHVRRVAEYSKILAEGMGLTEEEAEKIRLASMMHDIGKLMIPAHILEKPGRLTDEEYAEIKKHSGYGGKLLNSVEGDVMEMARSIALDHHERIDGCGYPEGKSGDSICIEGRIVAVADVYDALTSRRSYKEAWDEKPAYDEIVKGSGTQFDPKVIEVFKCVYPKINRVRMELADKIESLPPA